MRFARLIRRLGPWCTLLGWLSAIAVVRAGEDSVVTHLSQLREISLVNLKCVANLDLSGLVCEADAQNNFIILQDASGTELLGLDFGDIPLHAGQWVRITGNRCEITRRRTGLGLRRLPLVDNDGQHSVQEKSATVRLSPGRYPMAVEWFNAGGAAKLAVNFSGPGFGRRQIPDDWLTHEEFASSADPGREQSGLQFRSYEGYWRSLPDFESWPEAARGNCPNFELDTHAQGEHLARVYSGFLTIPQVGDYTFYLTSDDGSQLFLGERVPQVEILGETAQPIPSSMFIGQIAGTNDCGRWASVEGVVRYVATSGRRLELDLRSPSNNRMQVDVMDSAGLPGEYLLNSKVRLTGVGRQVFSPGAQSIWGLFTVGGAPDVQFLEVPNETWQALPVQSIAHAFAGTNREKIVHLSGTIRRPSPGQVIELSDATGKLTLDSPGFSAAVPSGSKVEVLGIPVVVGTNCVLKQPCLRVIYTSGDSQLPLLASAQQVLQLPRDQATRGYPVHLRGVITCVWPDDPRNYVLQDGSHGVFLEQSNIFLANHPQLGEFWDVQGVTGGGSFSPMIHAHSMERIGDGRLPEPAHAEWDQLVNGSLDNQYVEIEGVFLQVNTNTITLLARFGKINIVAYGKRPPGLEKYQNKLVRLRGCLQAVWDGQTHQVKPGDIRIGNLTINADQAYSLDPFAVPHRTAAELRLYDLQANAFRRIKMSGLYLQRRGDEHFMLSGTNGVRFLLNTEGHLHPGDLIEVAGVPDLRGAAPVLREAVVRKTATADFPAPKVIGGTNLFLPENDATYVVVEGVLVNVQRNQSDQILELRSGLRNFDVVVPAVQDSLEGLAPGSLLKLTGVYVGQSAGRNGWAALDSFDLLLRSPLDVQVLSRPPWWTFKRLLLMLTLVLGILALAGVWIVVLRRQVERRTAQLERVTRQREQAERARALDEERLRIARDLHDDLGSSLTEITMLGGMSLNESDQARNDYISQIVRKARDSVNALDVIVWAVNPRENTLQSLADYLASFADEFLSASGITGRLNLPVSFPSVTLDGRTRHDLFLATKEAMNNAVRHAGATEVELSLALEAGVLVVVVKDNGTGFTPANQGDAHGLGNMQGRLAKLGGQCQIESTLGQGTQVRLQLALPPTG